MNIFEVLADPTRRDILTQLRRSERSVNEIAAALEIGQPAASKHLKVLREAGFLSVTVAGQQRIYRLEPAAFKELDHWLAPYLRLWTKHLDALEKHLDAKEAKEKKDEARRVSGDASGRRHRGAGR